MTAPDGEVELLHIQGSINAEPVLAAFRANGIPARLAARHWARCMGSPWTDLARS